MADERFYCVKIGNAVEFMEGDELIVVLPCRIPVNDGEMCRKCYTDTEVKP
jgi:hypothetical protein